MQSGNGQYHAPPAPWIEEIDSQGKPSNERKGERAHWLVALLRLGYALSPIVVCTYTMISAIMSITFESSVTNPYSSSYVPSPNMKIIGYDDQWQATGEEFYSCDHPIRNPIAEVSCDTTLQSSIVYRSLMGSWLVYFSILWLYHLYLYAAEYSVNDLRFYLNILKVVTNPFNRYYVGLGLVYTAITVIVALVTIVPNPNANRPTTIFAILFAGVVNLLLMRPFMSTPALNMTYFDISKEFPTPIELRHLPSKEEQSIFNCYGVFVSVDRVVSLLLHYFAIDVINPDIDIFQKISDRPEELRWAISKLCDIRVNSGLPPLSHYKQTQHTNQKYKDDEGREVVDGIDGQFGATPLLFNNGNS